MRRRRRPYHYKPTTLTLDKLINLMETQEVIDLTRFSNGETWFKFLDTTLKESREGTETLVSRLVCPWETVGGGHRLQV